MSKLPLRPINWRTYVSILGKSCDAVTAICEYDVWQSDSGWAAEYYNRQTEAPTKTATGFATIDDAKEWCWNHYNEKMQPYVKPMPTWISVDERLPEHQDTLSEKDKCLVITKCGKIWMGFYNTHLKPDEWYLYGWSMNGGWHPFEITHWMPLPEPPEGE